MVSEYSYLESSFDNWEYRVRTCELWIQSPLPYQLGEFPRKEIELFIRSDKR